MTACDAIKGFSYYLKVERGLSPNTVSSYASDVAAFLDANDGKGPETLGVGEINHFLENKKNFSKRSQSRFLSSLKAFFSWMVTEGDMDNNPADLIDRPKIGRHLPDVLSLEEVEAILDSVDTSKWNGLRDKAILEILYGCGLRVSEAGDLKFSQIYTEEGFVRIIGKGNKERLVPIGEAALSALAAYAEQRPEPASPAFEDLVFLNRFGKALSRVSIFNMVKDQALLAGVRKEISPHTFRHSFATHLIENGADIRIVQEMLGHESILTTEIYTHIDSSTWQADILKHHPRNK